MEIRVLVRFASGRSLKPLPVVCRSCGGGRRDAGLVCHPSYCLVRSAGRERGSLPPAGSITPSLSVITEQKRLRDGIRGRSVAHRVSWEAATRLLNSMYITERQSWRIASSPSFLGEFAKLRKATVNFRIEQIGFHWTDFY